MSKTKTCLECIHFLSKGSLSGIEYNCIRRFRSIDPVTGQDRFYEILCTTERSRIVGWLGGCGPEGKFFESRIEGEGE